MPGFLEVCSDWELLDMVEGLRHPSTLERELAKRFRRRLEEEQRQKFEVPPTTNERKQDA